MENSQQLLTTIMHDYSTPEYKDLYKEILIDYNYRFPKFHPIPYPNWEDVQSKVNKTVPVLNPKPIRKLPTK